MLNPKFEIGQSRSRRVGQPAKAAHAIASGGGHQAAASADLGRVQTERQQIMHMVQMAVQEAIPGAVQQIMEEIRKAA